MARARRRRPWLFAAMGILVLAGVGLVAVKAVVLIDFINHALAAGQPLREAVIDAAAVRAKLIALAGWQR